MKNQKSRRNFIKKTAVLGTAASMFPQFTFANMASGNDEKLNVALIGVGLRGTNHLVNLLSREDVSITAICDIDPNRIKIALDHIQKADKPAPQVFSENDYDYRNLLELKIVKKYVVPKHLKSKALNLNLDHIQTEYNKRIKD